MNETLTASLGSLKIFAPDGSTASVFGYRKMTKSCARAVKQAKIADVNFHDLRQTFASRLVMAGVDLATVEELMGLKHITIALRSAHLALGHKRSAIVALDRIAEKVPTNFTTTAEGQSDHMVQVLEK